MSPKYHRVNGRVNTLQISYRFPCSTFLYCTRQKEEKSFLGLFHFIPTENTLLKFYLNVLCDTFVQIPDGKIVICLGPALEDQDNT